MSTTIYLSLGKIECCDCGIVFGMTEERIGQLRRSHDWFYCPTGHHQHFPHETEAEALRKRVATLQTDIEHKEARIRDLDRSRAALRGVHTRTCNRVKNGVCPCCNRTFSNLARHMHTEHPDFKAEVP